VSLRLSDEEIGALRGWARGSRRSLQREIVFRLFDGAVVTERGGPNGAQGDPASESSGGLTTAVGRSHETKELPRSVTSAGRREPRSSYCVHKVPFNKKCGVCDG
jgi:hypothetical protein